MTQLLCPNCRSAKVYGAGLWGFVMFCTSGCLLWIPIIGWILAPFLFLLAIVLWGTAIFSPTKRYSCGACHFIFELPKAGTAPDA